MENKSANKIYHSINKLKKINATLSVSDKMGFKTESITRDADISEC